MGESQDDPALAPARHEALYARINPRHDPANWHGGYAYATPVDMAKELLTLRGESTMALSPASLVTRALHTTSDFPIILGNTVSRCCAMPTRLHPLASAVLAARPRRGISGR